jgi:hypothetical protein
VKKTVLTFGVISGVLSSAMMLVAVLFIDEIGFDRGVFVGYTAIVLSFLLVFFGIRSYRDNVAGGAISFGRGFTVGILITLISCAFYVLSWLAYSDTLAPDFMDKYAAHVIEQARAGGATAEQIEAQTREMEAFRVTYANPFYKAAFTFLEPFPVGLLVTLISAGVLRARKTRAVSAQAL